MRYDKEPKTEVGGVFVNLLFFGMLTYLIFDLAEKMGPLIWGIVFILYVGYCATLAHRLGKK